MQDQEQLLQEKCVATGNWNELYVFSLSLGSSSKNKDLQSIPKHGLFFLSLLKEHHVKIFDILCIIIGTTLEEKACLHLNLIPAMMGSGYPE